MGPPRVLVPLFKQSLPVLLAGGTGLVLAGFALEYVEQWSVFARRPHLLVLLPMLLGLKCNLEMTLASRLSTAYHLGYFKGNFFSKSNRIMYANLGVVQIQALVVSVIATAITAFFGFVEGDPLQFADGIVVLATAFLTAWLAAVVLAVFTAGIMYVSAQRSLNPDNISGPLVASLGDLVAIVVMAVVAVVVDYVDSPIAVLVVVVVFAGAVSMYALELAGLDNATLQILVDGWQPLLTGLGISSTAGLLLGASVERLDGGVTVLLPLINGVGGNIAGIFASRTASSLHKREVKDASRNTEWTLLLLTVPTHAFFLFAMSLLVSRERIFTTLFVSSYLTAALIQVGTLLVLAQVLADRAWQQGLDPDNHVVPYLTALGDAVGTLSLVVISYIA